MSSLLINHQSKLIKLEDSNMNPIYFITAQTCTIISRLAPKVNENDQRLSELLEKNFDDVYAVIEKKLTEKLNAK